MTGTPPSGPRDLWCRHQTTHGRTHDSTLPPSLKRVLPLRVGRRSPNGTREGPWTDSDLPRRSYNSPGTVGTRLDHKVVLVLERSLALRGVRYHPEDFRSLTCLLHSLRTPTSFSSSVPCFRRTGDTTVSVTTKVSVVEEGTTVLGPTRIDRRMSWSRPDGPRTPNYTRALRRSTKDSTVSTTRVSA